MYQYINKKIITIILLLFIIINYKTINNLILNINKTTTYIKIITYIKDKFNKQIYTDNLLVHKLYRKEDILIDDNFYFFYIPKISGHKTSDKYLSKREALKILFEFIIKYKEKIPTFQEIINNPQESFMYESVIYNKIFPLIFFIIIFLTFFNILPIWLIFLITNIGLINLLLYPNHKIFLNYQAMKFFYFINLSPVILYGFYLLYKYIFTKKFFYYEGIIILSYLIIDICFLRYVKNIPVRYENIYKEIIKIKIIEKDNKFYLSKDSIKNFEKNILRKL